MTTAAVIGAGSWGTTFAKVMADAGTDVTMWARRREVANSINFEHVNSEYLPDTLLPNSISATDNLAVALRGAEIVCLAVPSQHLRRNLTEMLPYLDENATLVSLMKGVERESGLRMSEVIHAEISWPWEQIAAVSGPNLAKEIALEQPSAAVVAGSDHDKVQLVAESATNHYFTTFTNTDLVGTEFGGTLKNLVAVAVGIVTGVGYGDNTKASIITRGLAEVTRFAVAFGAQPDTMIGLAGLGDLIATCESPLSRNHTAGRLLGEGNPLEDVVDHMKQTAEGLWSVKPVLELAKERGITMPIVQQVSDVLDGTMDPRNIAPHLTSKDDSPQAE